MRWRNTYFCALAAFIVFAALPVSHGGTHLAMGSPGCMSAPSVPNAAVKPAPEAHSLQSHFGGCGHTLRSANLLPALRTMRAGELARQIAYVSRPHYGPLHRRPPPSFS